MFIGTGAGSAPHYRFPSWRAGLASPFCGTGRRGLLNRRPAESGESGTSGPHRAETELEKVGFHKANI
ncbi:hypothetical protein NDU88_005789 [Pleurodeles waltl]|uniref:Uncharacterized protein n=1 Tax=Pleurodeles waltl TaxID=8319 RepID=A0AAV7QFQ5_PLEWA|nr:hypothetical protein NDU88_005789 [Pleurodeles waltl]